MRRIRTSYSQKSEWKNLKNDSVGTDRRFEASFPADTNTVHKFQRNGPLGDRALPKCNNLI